MVEKFEKLFPNAKELDIPEIFSSVVFKYEENNKTYCIKLTKRNSIERLNSDYEYFKTHFSHEIANSQIIETDKGIVVKQEWIEGRRFFDIDNEELKEIIESNKEIQKTLINLLNQFLEAFKNKELYNDLVGYPKTHELFDSTNLYIVSKGNNHKIVQCDIGLSPHEDTLKKFGSEFYSFEEPNHYNEKMKETLDWIKSLD